MSDTDYAVCPGAWLDEWMEDYSMTFDRTCHLLGWSRLELEEFLVGKIPLVQSMAHDLEEVTSIRASVWISLEQLFCKDLERLGLVHPVSPEVQNMEAQYQARQDRIDNLKGWLHTQGISDGN